MSKTYCSSVVQSCSLLLQNGSPGRVIDLPQAAQGSTTTAQVSRFRSFPHRTSIFTLTLALLSGHPGGQEGTRGQRRVGVSLSGAPGMSPGGQGYAAEGTKPCLCEQGDQASLGLDRGKESEYPGLKQRAIQSVDRSPMGQ